MEMDNNFQEEKKEQGLVDKWSTKALKHSTSGIAGMFVGQALSSPYEAIKEDIRAKKLKEMEDPSKVVQFDDVRGYKSPKTDQRLKKVRAKRYVPKVGFPKTPLSLTMGTAGVLVGPSIIDKVVEKNKNKKISRELEKEASDNYRELPLLK